MIHRPNVNIAHPPLRKIFNFFASLFHPAFVTESRIRIRIDSFNARSPGAIRAGLVVESNFDFAIEPIVEQLPVLIAGFDLLAVNRDQVIAHTDLHPILVGRAIFVDIADAITSRRRVRLKFDAEITS